MDEGIERTIARGRFPSSRPLVHSEVNALERSIRDNERRVRGLVHELGTERDSIVGHATARRRELRRAESASRRNDQPGEEESRTGGEAGKPAPAEGDPGGKLQETATGGHAANAKPDATARDAESPPCKRGRGDLTKTRRTHVGKRLKGQRNQRGKASYNLFPHMYRFLLHESSLIMHL